LIYAIRFYIVVYSALKFILHAASAYDPAYGLRRILYIKAKSRYRAYQPQFASPIPFTGNNPR